jgi:hypothetical protein
MSKAGSTTPTAFFPSAIIGDSTSLDWRTEGVKEAANKQRDKIRQIGEALRRAGLDTLTKQASAMGLSRSTTWTILRASHKTSGLRAQLIRRMLAREELPSSVRCVLREYVIEKAQGHYGHSVERRRRFTAYFCDMPELAGSLTSK